MVATTGFAELFILLFMGGLGTSGMPLSIPPLPEDQALVSAAPEECLLYASWYGTAEPKSTSTNQVEQLLAEPEVRKFVNAIISETKRVLRRERDFAPVADSVFPTIEIVLTRPASAFLSKFNVDISNPRDPSFDVQAGAIVNAGRRAGELKTALSKLEAMMLEELDGEAEEVTVGGVKLRKLPLPVEAPKILWGFRQEYLIIAVGDGVAEKVIAGLKDARGPPKWLKQLHERLPIKRPAMVSYLNAKKVRETIIESAGGSGKIAERFIEVTGLGNIESVSNITGLDDTELVAKSLTATAGKPRGLLKLISNKPLVAKDLAVVPRDASWAVAARFDAAAAYDTVLEMIAEFNPRFAEGAKEELAELEDEIGFRILDDLLKPLGDTFVAYSSPSEGGLLVTGFNAVINVRDAAKLKATHDKLIKMIRDEDEDLLTTFEFAGQTIYLLDAGREVPLAPAWCLTGKELIVSLYPQTIKAYLSRKASGGSLAQRPEVATLLKDRPVTIAFQDTPQVFQTLYPILQMFAPMICHELRRAGFNINPDVLPSAQAIYPHLRPGVYSLSLREDGIYSVSRQSVPGSGGVTAMAPLMVGAMLPAVASARGAARRTQSMNNLKQFALAMHNYHDTHNAFPAPANYDANGKPLLSWRVHILPYLEQSELYKKFKLDEPWDSKHNRALIKQMPDIYKVPSRMEVGMYKTCYVVPFGDSTAFPKGQPGKTDGISLADVTDGTSNTIAIVEAAPDKGVIWTKPEDWKYDPEKPKAGLVGHRRGGFLAAYCDGSVRFLSEGIDAAVLKALFTRNGGEAVRQ